MKQASMPLAKWVSNSAEVADVLQREFQDKCLQAASIKVLGIKWLAASDVFSFRVASLPEGVCVTKRIVLSFFSRLFDPLGSTAPFAMLAKCLFQELWSLGLQWDDELPEEYKIQFLQWVDGLEILQIWTIPRSYTGVDWSQELSASWVLRCFPQRLWGMHFPEGGDGRGFCGYIFNHCQGQDCSSEEVSPSLFGTAGLFALFPFVGLCKRCSSAPTRLCVLLLDWFYDCSLVD